MNKNYVVGAVLIAIAILFVILTGCISTDDTEEKHEIVITNTDLHGTSSLFRQNVGQSFYSGEMTYIKEIKIKTLSRGDIENIRVFNKDTGGDVFNKVYDSFESAIGWNVFTIEKSIQKNTNYVIMIYSDNIEYRCTLYDSYPDGECYNHDNWDLLFEVHGYAS